MKHHRFIAAAFMIILGLSTSFLSAEYGLGSLSSMSAGYFPFVLGLILSALGGIVLLVPETSVSPAAPRFTLRAYVRPWSAIIGGMLAFIVLGHYGGLAPATFTLIMITALGDRNNSLKDSVLLAIGTTFFAIAVFHYGLNLAFPLWKL